MPSQSLPGKSMPSLPSLSVIEYATSFKLFHVNVSKVENVLIEFMSVMIMPAIQVAIVDA